MNNNTYFTEKTYSRLSKFFNKQIIIDDSNIKIVSSGSHSDTYICEVNGYNLKLFLKKGKNILSEINKTYKNIEVFRVNTKRYSIKNEYETLNSIAGLVKVPKVFDYLSSEDLLIMEYIPYPNLSRKLKRILWNPFSNFNTIKPHIDLVLEWLISYEKSIFENQTSEIGYFMPILKDKITKISFISNEEKRKATSFLENESSRFNQIPTIITNKDFKSHNILSNNNNIFVIDWEMVDSAAFIFWMPSTFIRTLSYDFYQSFFHKNKFELVESYFVENYLSKTIFTEFKDFYSLSSFFDLVIALSESPESQNITEPKGSISQSLTKFRNYIHG